MSAHYPIIAVTGSSGAGTSTAQRVFEQIFANLKLQAVVVEGDSFHAYERERWRQMLHGARIRGENLSLFGAQGNLFSRLEGLFAEFGAQGTGRIRHYLHTEAEADAARQNPGTFTPWQNIPANIDLLLYQGLHGALVTKEIDVARHVDLLVGVVPIVNLEWIQKIHRDTVERGYTSDQVRDAILRRMPDYVNFIVPQFSRTDVNFQRVPLVDTSNPFVAQNIPRPEESLTVIHLNAHARFEADFEGLLSLVPGATMTAERTITVPGQYQEQAMELLMGDAIQQLMARKAKSWAATRAAAQTLP